MELYYCGFNGFGMFPESKDLVINTFRKFPEQITSVCCAWSRMIFTTDSGCYVTGFLDGHTHQKKKIDIPEGSSIIQSACSERHALLVDNDGSCWCFERTGDLRKLNHFENTEQLIDEEEALLQGQELQNLSVPEKQKIIKVCCNVQQDVAISLAGNVYAIPSLLPGPRSKVTDIVCGREHCMLRTEDGLAYSWGVGSRGQLGHGELEQEEFPREISALSGLHVCKIAAGGWHSVAVTASGDLYSWGWNNCGQLGFCTQNVAKELSCLTKESTEINVTTNTDASSFTDMPHRKKLKTSTSEKPTESSTESQQAGSGGREFVSMLLVPTPIDWPNNETVNVAEVACGTKHTIVVQDDGSLWGCGSNKYSQLGLSGTPCCDAMMRLPFEHTDYETKKKIVDIACGDWSSLVCLQ